MIRGITLVNFRNFGEAKFDFFDEKNFIIGENGKGKTNILEAIALLGSNSLSHIDFDNLIANGETYFFIQCHYENGDSASISYNGKSKKKKYMINQKSVSKKKYISATHRCCIFSPIMMNMMYLSPGLRRDFLDTVLSASFEEYNGYLKEYKKIIKQRNAVLKQIAEKKCDVSEIDFWNKQFIHHCEIIYNYRNKFVGFLQQNMDSCDQYFNQKVKNVSFEYQTKVDQDNIISSLEQYLEKNFARDTLLGKTPIGPHIDDFDILVDGISLVQYASRGETKSVILWLKLLQAVFIEKMLSKKPIILIDDLLSELDIAHKDMFTNKIKYYQTIISSIDMVKEKNIITL